jgi:tripartite-type tricarboxylate transporter receptor subunit TctC
MARKPISYIGIIAVAFTILLMQFNFSEAKDWPSGSITMIMPYGAGSATDLLARMHCEAVQKSLGVPVIVENRTGAGGLLGLSLLSKAKADGYTFGFMSGTAITEKCFMREPPFDPIKSFSYICQVFDYTYGFCVKADSPWKTFPEFIAAAKKQPGKLTYATTSIGSTQHVAMAKLEQSMPGLKLTHIPIKESPKVVSAVLGGHVDACFQSPEWKPYVDNGQLRLLAVPQKERWKEYPNVPTWLDLGYGIYCQSHGAFVAPRNFPEDIRARLEREFRKAMDYPGVKSIINQFSLIETFKPGPKVYEEIMKMYDENKSIIPKLGIVEQ